MTAASVARPEVEAYLAAVREALADLPTDERDDLLAEVEASLLETASESERPIAARLGPPDAFAAELRAAAGLQASAPPGDAGPRLFDGLRAAVRRAATDPRVARARALALELAPIWWVARAYIAVAAVAVATDAQWSRVGIPRIETGVLGALTIVAAAIVSIWLGLRQRRRPAPAGAHLLRAANVVLVLAAIPVAGSVLDQAQPAGLVIQTVQVATPGLAFYGEPVLNIYPYSRGGRLLRDVLLFDGAGRPVDLGRDAPDPNRRVLFTQDGEPLYNSFPIRYFEPGTRIVARPSAGPRVSIPKVQTPPLRRLSVAAG